MKVAWGLMIWLAGALVAGAEGTSTAAVVSGEVADLVSSGRDCLMNGKMTEALALFEKAYSLDPASNEAAFGLSAAYLEMKRFDQALPMLEKLNKEVPDSPMVKNNLAWALLKATGAKPESAARAVKLARSALLDVPSDYSIWNTLGEAYYAAGQFEKGLSAAQSGLQLSNLAGATNSPSRELVARCRKAAGAASVDRDNDRP
jgi:tetratricopeptide (TPR) repeat protein